MVSLGFLSFLSFFPLSNPRGQSTHACKATDNKDRQQAEVKEMQVWRKQTISPPLCWPPVFFPLEEKILPVHTTPSCLFISLFFSRSHPWLLPRGQRQGSWVDAHCFLLLLLSLLLLLMYGSQFFSLPSIHFSTICYVIALCPIVPLHRPPVSLPLVIFFFFAIFWLRLSPSPSLCSLSNQSVTRTSGRQPPSKVLFHR